MSLQIDDSLVTADWLFSHLQDDNLVILDATIPKITSNSLVNKEKHQIKGAIFFDIKNDFSKTDASYPNTMISPQEFQDKARKLGINNTNCVVVYDDLGIYSSPRVWWMFQLMGFANCAVLQGGLPMWMEKKYPTEIPKVNSKRGKGDFIAKYQPQYIVFTKDVLQNLSTKKALLLDARSKERFFGSEPEPRKELQSGSIPHSKNLPYTEVLHQHGFKPLTELLSIFDGFQTTTKPFIFSCGSGITASILALAATLVGIKNYAVYDGSWTEWGSTNNLPIEKK